MPISKTLADEAKSVLVRGAGRAFEHTVHHIYDTLSGAPPRESPVALVQRLLEEGKLTAEAALYLATLGNALDQAGAFKLNRNAGLGSILERARAVHALMRD